MAELKYVAVNLLRRAELPSDLPSRLDEVPEVVTAFEARYNRPLSPVERQRLRLSSDELWVVVVMPEEKAILTTTDVAAQLGYSDEQIRRMCEAGRFDGDRTQGIPGAYRACVGAQWRIPREAVEWFLEATRPRSRTKPRSP